MISDFLPLIGTIGGVLVGAVIGSVLTARREHKKWLLERRYEAYRQFIATADRWNIRRSEDRAQAAGPEFYDEMTEAEGAIDLLGPPALAELMDEFRSTILKWDVIPDRDVDSNTHSRRYWELQRAFVSAARRELGAGGKKAAAARTAGGSTGS